MANQDDQEQKNQTQEEIDAAAKAAEEKAKADEEEGKKGTGKDNSAGKGSGDSASDLEAELKRRDGTIKSLSDKVEGYENFQKKLAGVFNPDGAEGKEPTLQDALNQIEELKKKDQLHEAEKQKDAIIDELEVSDARKRELKRRVSASSEDIQKAIEDENNYLNILLENEGVKKEEQNQPRYISNRRPAAAQFSKNIPNSDNAAEILAAANAK